MTSSQQLFNHNFNTTVEIYHSYYNVIFQLCSCMYFIGWDDILMDAVTKWSVCFCWSPVCWQSGLIQMNEGVAVFHTGLLYVSLNVSLKAFILQVMPTLEAMWTRKPWTVALSLFLTGLEFSATWCHCAKGCISQSHLWKHASLVGYVVMWMVLAISSVYFKIVTTKDGKSFQKCTIFSVSGTNYCAVFWLISCLNTCSIPPAGFPGSLTYCDYNYISVTWTLIVCQHSVMSWSFNSF